MSRSYRTDPKWKIAARNAAGDVQLPRIVERRPRHGDVLPIPKVRLTRMIAALPLEHHYGLAAIELRARQGAVVFPFAEYCPRSKTVRLCSLPSAFVVPGMTPFQFRLCEFAGATIEKQKRGIAVSWRNARSMGFWFYYDVVVHALGHHHRTQYPSKTGPTGRRSHDEHQADHFGYDVLDGRNRPRIERSSAITRRADQDVDRWHGRSRTLAAPPAWPPSLPIVHNLCI